MKRTTSYLAGTLILLALLVSIGACSSDDTTTTTATTTATSTSTSAPAETTTTTTTTQATTPTTTSSSPATSATTSSPVTSTETTTSTPAETTTTPALDEAEVRAFADDIAVTMMEGFSEADFEKYTRHANETFKEAIKEEQFLEAADVIEEQIGTFISLTFLNFEIADNYIIVHYSAEYTDATVGVVISFDEDRLAAGQFFE